MAWDILRKKMDKKSLAEKENQDEMRSLRESRGELSGSDWDHGEDDETEEFNKKKAQKKAVDAIPGRDTVREQEIDLDDELESDFPSSTDQTGVESRINRLHKRAIKMDRDEFADDDIKDALAMKIKALQRMRKSPTIKTTKVVAR